MHPITDKIRISSYVFPTTESRIDCIDKIITEFLEDCVEAFELEYGGNKNQMRSVLYLAEPKRKA